MNNTQALAYLMQDGNLRVPCSRYGSDSQTCAEVAVRVWEILLPELPESNPVELLDHIMGLVVNDHDDPEHTLRQYGTPEDWERFEVPIYVVTENTPGYMPDSDDPATFQDFESALAYGKELRENLLDFYSEMGGLESDLEQPVPPRSDDDPDYGEGDTDTEEDESFRRKIEKQDTDSAPGGYDNPAAPYEDIGEDYAEFYVARDAQDLGRVITVERIED